MELQKNETLLVEDELSREELSKMAEEISELIGKVEELENEKKEFTADINLKIKDIDNDIRDKAQIVRQGYQVKPVACEIVYDFPRKVKHYYRIDTQDLVETRNLSAAEMQKDLFEGQEGG